MSDKKENEVDDVIIKIDALAFKRALAFTAIDDVRYYLNGVHIASAPVVRIEGTDGFRLYVEDVPTATAKRSAILKLSPSGRRFLCALRNVVLRTDGSLKIETFDGFPLYVEPHKAEIDCAGFPDVRALIGDLSEWEPGIPQSFNADLLRSLISAPGNVRFFYKPTQGSKGPLLIAYGNHKDAARGNAIGVLMPLREIPLNRPLLQLVPSSLIPEPLPANNTGDKAA